MVFAEFLRYLSLISPQALSELCKSVNYSKHSGYSINFIFSEKNLTPLLTSDLNWLIPGHLNNFILGLPLYHHLEHVFFLLHRFTYSLEAVTPISLVTPSFNVVRPLISPQWLLVEGRVDKSTKPTLQDEDSGLLECHHRGLHPP